MLQDIYERSKRDSSSSGGSDSSSSGSSSSSSGGDGDNTTPVDECALLGNFIQSQVATLPAGFAELVNATLVAQVVPEFFDLLTSAPTLFADMTLAIASAANLITTPDTGTNEAGIAGLAALVPDFVALANDACGVSLSPDQLRNVDSLFFVVLPAFFFLE